MRELEERAAGWLRAWSAEDLCWRPVWSSQLGRRAGLAFLESGRIELNAPLLAEHPDRIDETLAHELAHLVAWRRHGSACRLHGPEWQDLLVAIGMPARRYHGLLGDSADEVEVASANNQAGSYYLHLCTGCDAWWLAARVDTERSCPDCGPGEVEVHRAARSAEGRAALERIARGEEA